MFYTLIFLTFEWDEMYRYVFYTYIFLERKIPITSKMFYFLDTPVWHLYNRFVSKLSRYGILVHIIDKKIKYFATF